MTDAPSAALMARLAPGEAVLIHHRPDTSDRLRWRRLFQGLFLILMLVVAGVLALVAHDFVAEFWWVGLLAFAAVEAWIVLVFRIDAKGDSGRELVVTPRRILWAQGGELALEPGMKAVASGSAVRLHSDHRAYRLGFPGDAQGLADKLNGVIATLEEAKP